MALGWLVILVGATVHPGDLAYLQGTPLKRKMSNILGNWAKKKFLKYLQLNCPLIAPY